MVTLRISLNTRELIILRALNGIVKDEHSTMVTGLEDENVLELGFLMVQDIVDLEGHRLARPHLTNLSEPAI